MSKILIQAGIRRVEVESSGGLDVSILDKKKELVK